jgi:outer membrane protein
MKVRLILGWLVVLSLVTAIGYAQQPPARRLALAEALRIARENNPDYRAVQNDRWVASAEVLSSTALLFPTASIGGSRYSSQAGDGFVGGLSYHTFSTTRLGWSFGVDYQLSGRVIATRWAVRAQARATDADIDVARSNLDMSVRQQYLSVLQSQAQVALAQHVLEKANETLNLAQAKNAVGQGTLIEVRRAEVDKGTAEVGLLRANQAVENQLLGLYQYLGVPAPQPVSVVLTDSFPVTAPALDQDSLVSLALRVNPSLVALRARETAATWQVRSANSQYLPSLFASASYGKYRANQGAWKTDSLNRLVLDTLGHPIEERRIATGSNPWNLQIGISLPLFDGFQRNVTTAQARAARDDVRQNIRRGELYLRAGVTAAYLALVSAYQTIGIQANNKVASAEALSLATQRYRVGNGTFLELLDARVTAEQAEASYVGAVYDYHKAYAALENAVGRPLR